MSLAELDQRGETIQAVGLPPAGNTQTVSISTTSANSTALAKGLYRILASENAHITSSAPATDSDMPIVANVEEYFRIDTDTIISARTATGTGTLYLTLMT